MIQGGNGWDGRKPKFVANNHRHFCSSALNGTPPLTLGVGNGEEAETLKLPPQLSTMLFSQLEGLGRVLKNRQPKTPNWGQEDTAVVWTQVPVTLKWFAFWCNMLSLKESLKLGMTLSKHRVRRQPRQLICRDSLSDGEEILIIPVRGLALVIGRITGRMILDLHPKWLSTYIFIKFQITRVKKQFWSLLKRKLKTNYLEWKSHWYQMILCMTLNSR